MARRKKRKSAPGAFIFTVYFLILLAFYLWGSVEINLVILENDDLIEKQDLYAQQVNDLRMQINHMRSYQRIAPLAKELGLSAVPAVMLDEIAVDMNSHNKITVRKKNIVQYAGLIRILESKSP